MSHLRATGGLNAAACLFHGFSDPSRIAILRHLSLGEHRVVDLTAHLGLAQSTVSKHLACLRDCGLVTARPVGRATVYSLKVVTQPALTCWPLWRNRGGAESMPEPFIQWRTTRSSGFTLRTPGPAATMVPAPS